MAKQIGAIKFRGCIDNVCFYKMGGEYYARKKSSLTAKRVKTDPAFTLTMVHANVMRVASPLASAIRKERKAAGYESAPYREVVSEVMALLREGVSAEEIRAMMVEVSGEWAVVRGVRSDVKGERLDVSGEQADVKPRKKRYRSIASLKRKGVPALSYADMILSSVFPPFKPKRNGRSMRSSERILSPTVSACSSSAFTCGIAPAVKTQMLHIQRVRNILPAKGHVGIMCITNNQFGMMEIFRGKEQVESPETVQQLELF